MAFLKLLETIRTPILNTFFSLVTYIGDESLFIGIGVALYWCIDKITGYYALTVGFVGTLINQFLKLTFRIPRPWILDPDFTIVESARAGASGYSFPSGHTANAVGTYGAIANRHRKKAVVIPAIITIVLVSFSRMYLGVHTPADVGVSIAIGIVLVFAILPIFNYCYGSAKRMNILFACLVATALIYTLYVELHVWPADIDPLNHDEGIKSGYMLLGAALGLWISFNLDEKYIHFETKASLPVQLVKLVFGLAITLGLKAAIKAPLYNIIPSKGIADAVRYFITIMFVGTVWPLTFPYIKKIFKTPDKEISK